MQSATASVIPDCNLTEQHRIPAKPHFTACAGVVFALETTQKHLEFRWVCTITLCLCLWYTIVQNVDKTGFQRYILIEQRRSDVRLRTLFFEQVTICPFKVIKCRSGPLSCEDASGEYGRAGAGTGEGFFHKITAQYRSGGRFTADQGNT